MITKAIVSVMIALSPVIASATPTAQHEVARVEKIAAASRGLPAGRVIWRWYDPHTPGLLGMPIGPACWGLVIQPRFSFKQYSECVPEADWKAHPMGTWFGPSD